ncbi:hypothetical protein LTR85_010643 [Meristemomyces frigidus]|nr:hypothetical protein LTR85_010643 [Meristemomyces frigidus]
MPHGSRLMWATSETVERLSPQSSVFDVQPVVSVVTFTLSYALLLFASSLFCAPLVALSLLCKSVAMFPQTITLGSLLVASAAAATLPSQCGCGYSDPETQQLFTESIIVYFNETDTIDSNVFTIQDYAHKKEQGWNAIYKQGAKPANVQFENDTAFYPPLQVLNLQTDPYIQHNHVVYGGNIETVRKDIQYGSFRAALKSANQWTGGTALSMLLRYNTSDSLEVDFMNMDDPADAAVSNLVNGEWPSLDYLTNYTILEAAGLKPWSSFISARMDWNKTDVAFYIADNKTRSITKKERTLPQAGQPLQLKTWSTGDTTWMEGPPSVNASHSRVAWMRAFFNSSTMTSAEHHAFNQRCADAAFCSTEDMSLRGSTAYSPASTLRWKDPPNDKSIRQNAGIVAACCSSFGIFALINVFFRRTPWASLRLGKGKSGDATDALRSYLRRSLYKKPASKSASNSSTDLARAQDKMPSGMSTPSIQTPLPIYGAATPRSGYQTPVPPYERRSFESTPPVPPLNSAYRSRSASAASLQYPPSSSQPYQGAHDSDAGTKAFDEKDMAVLDRIEEAPRDEQTTHDYFQPSNPFTDSHAIINHFDEKRSLQPAATVSEKGKEAAVTVTPLEANAKSEAAAGILGAPVKPTPTKRIDYLAGLVAVACLGVTLHHFCQTFWPWVTNGYGPGAHYVKVEKWLQIFLGSYLLTQLWIGPFFLTATRFLSTNYLKNGNLEDIAKKELRRAPRLFVPIIITSLLEYFLISMDLTAALQYLPSVSYSTWPYVVQQPNFGAYINNIIELLYLMPNAIPEIVTHYCIGVLWTVPVQLQFTYVVLTAAVLIRDIKNPWKRFGFYTLMIVSSWYAKSWASCHWCGLVLSDLEATYKWRTYLGKRPLAYWAVIFGAFVGATCAPLASVFAQDWTFDTFENSLHPDFATGKPIMEVKSVYPGYNEPTLTIIGFSIGLQILVELSPLVQKFLSMKMILWLHPHIMTVYLTHGFVMWTWGAWCAVALDTAGVPYWGVLLVTLITTYALIFALATVLTPAIEIPTQAMMRNLDRWTKDESIPKRRTTAPFNKDIVVNRQGGGQAASEL